MVQFTVKVICSSSHHRYCFVPSWFALCIQECRLSTS